MGVERKPFVPAVDDRIRAEAVKVLPFRLTPGQRQSLKEIVEDDCLSTVSEVATEFARRTGLEVHVGTVRSALKRAGIERHVHPHMLRHAFAAHMVQGGADLRTVQLLLGHANLATVQVYLQFDDRWLREAHRRYHPRG